MITLAIVAILMTVAAPSVRQLAMNVRMTSQVNDLMADLQLARSESVKRNLGVFLCASSNESDCNSNSWNTGWVVFADLDGDGSKGVAEAVLKSRPALEGNNTIQSAGHLTVGSVPHVPYRPTGLSSPGGVMFVLCDTRTEANSGRRVRINNTGRAQYLRETCPATP